MRTSGWKISWWGCGCWHKFWVVIGVVRCNISFQGLDDDVCACVELFLRSAAYAGLTIRVGPPAVGCNIGQAGV